VEVSNLNEIKTNSAEQLKFQKWLLVLSSKYFILPSHNARILKAYAHGTWDITLGIT
jgi:hypothetical protein